MEETSKGNNLLAMRRKIKEKNACAGRVGGKNAMFRVKSNFQHAHGKDPTPPATYLGGKGKGRET